MSKVASVKIESVEQAFPAGTEGGDWLLYVRSTEKPPAHEGKYISPTPRFIVPVEGGNTYTFEAGRIDSDAAAILGGTVTTTIQVPDDGIGEVMIEVASGITASVIDAPEPK